MKEGITKLQEQEREGDISVQAPEETILDTNQEKLVQTLKDGKEKMEVEHGDSVNNNVNGKIDKLTENLNSGTESGDLKEFEGLTP